MFDKFTEKSMKVIMLAREEARMLGHNDVTPEFILLGIVQAAPSIATKVLRSAGVGLARVREEVKKKLGVGSGCRVDAVPFNASAKRLLEGSWEEAKKLQVTYIGAEHILLSSLSVEDDSLGSVLDALGIDRTSLRQSILTAITQDVADKEAEQTLPVEFIQAIELIRREKKRLIDSQEFELAGRLLEQEHELIKRFKEIAMMIISGKVTG